VFLYLVLKLCPVLQAFLPLSWNLGKHVDLERAGSSERLVSCVVVAFSEFGQCLRLSAMKCENFSLTATEGRGSPPYFVERYERIVDIEECVFKSFGHERSGELLPAHDEIQSRFALVRQKMGRFLTAKHPQ